MNKTLADKVRGLKQKHAENCETVRGPLPVVHTGRPGVFRFYSCPRCKSEEQTGNGWWDNPGSVLHAPSCPSLRQCDCGADAFNAKIESIAAEAERAPVTGEVRGMAEEALRLDKQTPAGPWQAFDRAGIRCVTFDDPRKEVVRWVGFDGVDDAPALVAFIARARTLLPALARALLAAPVAPASDDPSVPDFLAAVREMRAKLSAAGIRLRDHDEDEAPVAPVTEGDVLRELERVVRAEFATAPCCDSPETGCYECRIKGALARLDATRTGGGQ